MEIWPADMDDERQAGWHSSGHEIAYPFRDI
jgi:hypothetical protein